MMARKKSNIKFKENSTCFIKISRDQTESASQADTHFHPAAAIFPRISQPPHFLGSNFSYSWIVGGSSLP